MNTIEIIFWVFLFVVFYTYLGYGIFLYFLVLIKECFVKKTVTSSVFTDLPEVTLLIAAYNEEDIVDEKMLNTRSLEYPNEKLTVVWITDGTTDASNEKLAAYNEVQVLFEPARQGKTAALNRAIPYIKSPIIVFTDANTMLNNLAIMEIVNAFRDIKTGCVAGEKRIASKEKDSASSGGEGIYWKYESTLKSLDSRLYSAVGAAGELFAIRRELFEKMDKDTLLDDFILSMKIAMKGYKISYCSNAYAIETGTLNMEEEKKRKIRIAAGGVQSVYRLAALLNIFKYGVLSFQYISHRVLRWTITPVLLFLLFPVNIALVIEDKSILYSVLLFMQVLFYSLALLGKHNEGKELKNKFIFIPHYFLFMNLNVVKGFFYLLKKKRGDGTWDKSQRMKK